MGYYTVVPHVRNQKNDGYVTNFCEGKWKVFHEGKWLELRPDNTRIRDKNNAAWVEVCAGQKVEIALDDPNLDCKCYSKNFTESLNRDVNSRVFEQAEHNQIDFMLYGNLIQAYDEEPYLYMLYTIPDEKGYRLKLYILNKTTSAIDNIAIDTVQTNLATIVVEEGRVVIYCGNFRYTVDYSYVINADLCDYVPQYFLRYGSVYKITDKLLLNDQPLFNVQSLSNSFVIFEGTLCLATYLENIVTLYDMDGNVRAESVSDANFVFLFNIGESLASVEGYDNYIRVKGIENDND